MGDRAFDKTHSCRLSFLHYSMDGTVSCAVEKHQIFPISNRFLVNSNAKSIQIQNISQRSLKDTMMMVIGQYQLGSG